MKCGQALVYLAFICSFSSTSGFLFGLVEPNDPHYEVGETLNLTCSPERDTEFEWDIKSVYFQHKANRLPDEYVHVISPYEAELVIPNVDLSHNGPYYCYVNVTGANKGKLVYLQHVTVGTKPRKPDIATCKIPNWGDMLCTWSNKEQEPSSVKTNVELEYKLESSSSWSTCDKTLVTNTKDRYNCTLKPNFQEKIQMRVKADNYFGVTVSDVHAVESIKIVVPSAIREASIKEEIGSKSVELSWGSPAPNQEPMVYEVTHYSEWDTEVMRTLVASKTHHTIIDLTPSSTYTIKIISRVKDALYWSEPRIFQLKTLPTKPEFNPKVTKNNFEKKWNEQEGLWDITLYWQSVSKRHHYGEDFHYNVYNSEGRKLGTASGSAVQTKVSVINSNVDLYVVSSNGEGDSIIEDPTLIHITSAGLRPPRRFDIIELSEKIVVLRWTDTPGAKGYTLYWCEGDNHLRCKTSLQWVYVEKGENKYMLELEKSYGKYVFAISAENEESSTGMVWAPSCVLSNSGVALPPKDVKFFPEQDAESIHLHWTPPPCKPHSGYVTGYNVYFCIYEEDKCKGPLMIEYVQNNLDTAHRLKGLKGGAKYKVFMASHSDKGQSIFSPDIYITVKQSWLTGGVIAGIVVGVIFIIVLAVLAAIAIVTQFRRIKKCLHIQITLPDDTHNGGNDSLEGMDQETRFIYNTQKSVSAFSQDSGRGGSVVEDGNSPRPLLVRSVSTESDVFPERDDYVPIDQISDMYGYSKCAKGWHNNPVPPSSGFCSAQTSGDFSSASPYDFSNGSIGVDYVKQAKKKSLTRSQDSGLDYSRCSKDYQRLDTDDPGIDDVCDYSVTAAGPPGEPIGAAPLRPMSNGYVAYPPELLQPSTPRTFQPPDPPKSQEANNNTQPYQANTCDDSGASRPAAAGACGGGYITAEQAQSLAPPPSEPSQVAFTPVSNGYVTVDMMGRPTALSVVEEENSGDIA